MRGRWIMVAAITLAVAACAETRAPEKAGADKGGLCPTAEADAARVRCQEGCGVKDGRVDSDPATAACARTCWDKHPVPAYTFERVVACGFCRPFTASGPGTTMSLAECVEREEKGAAR